MLLKNLIVFSIVVSCSLCLKAEEKWTGYWEKPRITISTPESGSFPGLGRSAALVWIRIYQLGISSQDLPSCVFEPSCSRFAFSAIQRFGVVKGIGLAADRLLRCNPFAYRYYRFNGVKFIDPVSDYDFRK
jgi:putative membrane protein insertion efficiency factor